MGKVVFKIVSREDWKYVYMLVLVVFFYFWVICMVFELVVEGIFYIGWIILIGFFVYGIVICYFIWEKYVIYGNMIEDFFVVMLIYFFVVY